jgi:hypothetical protein
VAVRGGARSTSDRASFVAAPGTKKPAIVQGSWNRPTTKVLYPRAQRRHTVLYVERLGHVAGAVRVTSTAEAFGARASGEEHRPSTSL